MKAHHRHAVLALLTVLLCLSLVFSGCRQTQSPPSGPAESTGPEATQETTTHTTQEPTTDVTEAPTTEVTLPGQCTHSYEPWQTLEEASCTQPGRKQRSCSLCGDVQTETVPAGHKEVTDAAVAATCTQPGKTAGKHCSVCNTVLTAQQEIPATGHKEVPAVAVAPTCTQPGKTAGTHCAYCNLAFVAQETIPATGHAEVADKAVAATCTQPGKTAGKHCSVCKAVLVAQDPIPAAGHKEVVIPGVAPTETVGGTTDGKKCGVCHVILIQQTELKPWLELCGGDYAYNALGKKANGTALQALYTRIDAEAVDFHCSSTRNATDNIALTVPFADLGLTHQDAIQVWMSYKNDNPLFYWISATFSFSDTELSLHTDSAYASASARKAYNASIYDKLKSYAAVAAKEASAYQIAMAYHDLIIDTIDYAYENDDLNAAIPEDAAWAHNILGVFEQSKGVCEAYARTFQLLLNVRGVENILVTGVAGHYGQQEDHAWNLVKLDDGKWYWCDLTWDDQPGWEWGITYNYFCVNDTQNVNWWDDSGPQPAQNFLASHTPNTATNSNIVYDLELPARSSSEFAGSDILLRDTFTVDKLTYAVAGYRTVQLTKVGKNGALNIPETVTYKGKQYTVISMGSIDENGYFKGGLVLAENTVVTIPKSIRFIWDNALNCYYAEKYIVDANNPYFTSVNGVVYTKSLYTLIQYPSNAPKITKFVIPDATARVAYGAMGSIRNPFDELVIGANLVNFGFTNWGSGYADKLPSGTIVGNVVTGDLGRLYNNSSTGGKHLKISVSPNNQSFLVQENILYLRDENGQPGAVMVAMDPTVTSVVLPDTVTEIQEYGFAGCTELTSLSMGPNMIYINSGVFSNCPKLKAITFRGTKAQWEQVGKFDWWDGGSSIAVHCTDGTV